MTATITVHTLYTINWVRDEIVDTQAPCPECSDMDAFVIMNLYVREFGQCTRFVECCLNCGKRIALEEGAAEVLIEVPQSLRIDVEREMA